MCAPPPKKKAVTALAELGVDLRLRDRVLMTALAHCVANGHCAAVAALAQLSGTDMATETDSAGRPLLFLAVEKGHREVRVWE